MTRANATTATLANRAWKIVGRGLRRLIHPGLTLTLLLVLVQSSAIPPSQYFGYRLGMIIAGYQFNMAAWELHTLTDKGRLILTQEASSLSPSEQEARVRTFFAREQDIQDLEAELQRMYSITPDQTPEKAQALQAELDALVQQQAQERGTVEAILENQVAGVLAEEQFKIGPAVWPPVFCRLTDPPTYLIVSLRDRIARKADAQLQPRLAISQREQLEDTIDETLDVSSLVDNLGGLSAFPAIIVSSPSIAYTVETIAHEWTHYYLAFTPLGWHYGDSGDLTTMNETVASIVGAEVGYKVMRRHYPDLAPAPPGPPPPPVPQEEQAFDFNRVMRETRLEVDRLLAEGKIEEAEAYMESQRQLLVAHGYRLRKLNQAYFAFHGAYAAGAATVDPIGPQLWRLHSASPSLKAFLRQVSGMRSYADLQRATQGLGAP